MDRIDREGIFGAVSIVLLVSAAFLSLLSSIAPWTIVVVLFMIGIGAFLILEPFWGKWVWSENEDRGGDT